MENLEQIKAAALAAVEATADLRALDEVRVQYLGKKGEISALLKGLGALSAEERPAAGARIYVVRDAVQEAIETRKQALENAALDAKLAGERIDVTLPGRGEQAGALRQLGRHHHARGHRLAVQPGAVAHAGLDGMAEGMPKIQRSAHT